MNVLQGTGNVVGGSVGSQAVADVERNSFRYEVIHSLVVCLVIRLLLCYKKFVRYQNFIYFVSGSVGSQAVADVER